MITLAIVSIVGLFAVFIALKSVTPVKICALCASVAATRLGLLALKLIWGIGGLMLIAILMGESITGIMYRFGYSMKPKRNPLVDLSIIASGTVIVYYITTGIIEKGAVVVSGVVLALALGATVIIKNPASRISKQLQKGLEKCCE